MTKEAKKTQITEQICKQAQLMRKGGASQTEIAQLLGVNACTISRIEAAGFDFEKYTENRKERRAKEKQKLVISADKMNAAVNQVPGQMEMEIPEGVVREDAYNYRAADPVQPVTNINIIDQEKMMRFQAEMTGKIVKAVGDSQVLICMKLDKLNDTLCQILRAVRRE